MRYLVGRFNKLVVYRECNELLSILRSEFHKTNDLVKRLMIFPEDVNITTIIYYQTHEKPLKIYTVTDNELLKTTWKTLMKVFTSNSGSVEVYLLARDEYRIDEEVLHRYSLLKGLREPYLEIHPIEFIDRIHGELKSKGKKMSKTYSSIDGDSLSLSKTLSSKLKDLSYRARIILGNFNTLMVKYNELITTIDEILHRERDIAIHFRVNNYDVWIIRDKEINIGALIIDQISNTVIEDINDYNSLLNKINEILNLVKTPSNKPVRIFIYKSS